jgi:hypothetical protein
MVMAKVLIKMGSLSLQSNQGGLAGSTMQEESKIADEQDWQHQID